MTNYYFYKDNDGVRHYFSPQDMSDLVQIKVQLQKANGKCNWNKLKRFAARDGINKNKIQVGERFRCFIKDFQKAHHMQNKHMIPKSIQEKLGELSYRKREVQNYTREFNKLKRHLIDGSVMRNRILDVLKQAHFNFKVQHNEMRRKTSNKVLLAAFADLHVGAWINQPKNKYNADIAQTRVSLYAIKLLRIALKNNVKTVYIANIGDMIENVYMRFSQGFDTELTLGEQITRSCSILRGFLVFLYEKLSKHGIKLKYVGIAGNHDRLNGNKKKNIYNDNAMIIINYFIKYMADTFFKKSFFEYINPDSIYRTHLDIDGNNIKIVHGDLDNLTKSSTMGKIDTYDGRDYRLILGGHRHRYSVLEVGKNKYLVTSGCFKGDDKYSDQLSVGASLSQAVTLIDGHQLSTMNVEL